MIKVRKHVRLLPFLYSEVLTSDVTSWFEHTLAPGGCQAKYAQLGLSICLLAFRSEASILAVVKQTGFDSEVTGVLWVFRVQGPDDPSPRRESYMVCQRSLEGARQREGPSWVHSVKQSARMLWR